jgi:hypothetical protein
MARCDDLDEMRVLCRESPASDAARIWQPWFPSRPIDSNVDEAFRRNVSESTPRWKNKISCPNTLGLMLNHMHWATEVCLKVEDGDGYLAHRILGW